MSIDSILDRYKKREDGVIEIVGANVQDIGIALNHQARAAGIPNPVFHEKNDRYWNFELSETENKVEIDKIYRFRLVPTSKLFFLHASNESSDSSPPLGIVALAEACERLLSRDKSSLFQDCDGEKLWVSGEVEDVALWSSATLGVEVICFDPDPNAHGFSIYSTLRYVQRPCFS